VADGALGSFAVDGLDRAIITVPCYTEYCRTSWCKCVGSRREEHSVLARWHAVCRTSELWLLARASSALLHNAIAYARCHKLPGWHARVALGLIVSRYALNLLYPEPNRYLRSALFKPRQHVRYGNGPMP
jgi:hypothetical protein